MSQLDFDLSDVTAQTLKPGDETAWHGRPLRIMTIFEPNVNGRVPVLAQRLDDLPGWRDTCMPFLDQLDWFKSP